MRILLIVLFITSSAQAMERLSALADALVHRLKLTTQTQQEVPEVVAAPQEALPIIAREEALAEPQLPTFFQIHNKTDSFVYLSVLFNELGKSKRYVMHKGVSMIILSPQFLSCRSIIAQTGDNDKDVAEFVFVDPLYVKLAILKHPAIKTQLCIRQIM